MQDNRTFEHVLHVMAGAGPLLFLTVATGLGFFRAGYDPIAQPISALGVGPQGWMQGLNFALLTVSLLSFAAVLKKQLAHGVSSIAGPGIILVMALGVALAGIFPMDAPGAQPTLVGRLHTLGGFLVFPWMPMAVLLVARRFRRDARWRSHFAFTLAIGLFCLAVIVFFLAFAGPPGTPPRFATPFAGLIQRIQLLPFFIWIALISREAYRLGHDQSVPTHARTRSAAVL